MGSIFLRIKTAKRKHGGEGESQGRKGFWGKEKSTKAGNENSGMGNTTRDKLRDKYLTVKKRGNAY